MGRGLAVRPLAPGLRLRTWTLGERIGVGADGEVWAATDGHGARAALKIRPRAAGGRQDEARLRQEFERLRVLRIPNVVRVLEVGSDQGYVYFAMERAHGVPFDATWAAAAAPDPAGRVRAVARAGAALARSLAGIHRLQLAHRDVKPANVLVSPTGSVTVLDFGTARLAAAAARRDEGRRAGTPAYMAPEQRLDLPHDHRVDLYALGSTLHEALSGTPARSWRVGARRPSLALDGPHVPRALADLVDGLLALDPAERPSAEEAQELLDRVARDAPLPPAGWPLPVAWPAEPAPLLAGHCFVAGEVGEGRRRLVEEARRRWFADGYRSVAGTCRAEHPYSALSDVFRALLGPLGARARRALLGEDAAVLAVLWPGLPLPSGTAPDRGAGPREVAAALVALVERVVARHGPLALVLWDVDEADPGTTRTLPVLARSLPDTTRLWLTGRRPGFGLPAVRPPRWTAADEAALRAELLPGAPAADGPPRPPAPTPLQALQRAWGDLARSRGEPPPADPLPAELLALSVLALPFPREVAADLVRDGAAGIDRLLARGLLRPNPDQPDPEQPSRLVPADLGTWTLAGAALARREGARSRARARAARAWRGATELPDHLDQAAVLAARSGQDPGAALDAAIRQELGRGRPVVLERWLRLRALHAGGDAAALLQDSGGFARAFELSYARLLVDLELRPTAVRPADLDALAERARSPREQALAAYLRVVLDARRGDRAAAATLGRRQARAVRDTDPVLAADLLREVALAGILRNELPTAVQDARAALSLARSAAADGAPGRSEVAATTTLSAALLYAGQVREAVVLCGQGAARFRAAGVHRGEGALLANRAIGHLFLGRREEAEADVARGRAVQAAHRDPVVLANLAVTRARLVVEAGDVRAGRVLVDEALTAAAASGDPHLAGEAWCVALEAAVHTADPAEADRAVRAYATGQAEGAVGSAWDHWPAVLARWRWLTGDLRGALQATEEVRQGHGDLCIRAERTRLLLVAGRYHEAEVQAVQVAEAAEAVDQLELAAFARLVHGAAVAEDDPTFLRRLADTHHSRWVHLYMGGLHLDAVRRRLRGENVHGLLRQLRARARDAGHRLYAALARSQGW